MGPKEEGREKQEEKVAGHKEPQVIPGEFVARRRQRVDGGAPESKKDYQRKRAKYDPADEAQSMDGIVFGGADKGQDEERKGRESLEESTETSPQQSTRQKDESIDEEQRVEKDCHIVQPH